MVAITKGAGLSSAQGQRVQLPGDVPTTMGLAQVLGKIRGGSERWWSGHLWAGDYRAAEKWQGARVIVVDVDHHDAAGKHAPPPEERAARLEGAALAGTFGANLYHRSPRGCRFIYLLTETITDPAPYKRATAGACALVAAHLERLGLAADATSGRPLDGYEVDQAATCDLARLFFVPDTTVKGERRQAALHVMRGDAYGAESFETHIPAEKPKRATPRTGIVVGDPSNDLAEAAPQWNRDHAADYPRTREACPACQHNDCWGQCKDNPDRWSCFSANHGEDSGGCGRPSEDGKSWTGDAVDLEACRRGKSPVQVLRDDGYFAAALQDSPESRQRATEPASNGDGPPIAPADISPNSLISQTEEQWPDPPDEAAFYGLAGDIVHAISPHTEADDMALLAHLLVGFGNIVGRRPNLVLDGKRHGMNLSTVLVGRSSRGRKGTAWARISPLFQAVDPVWFNTRIESGLSSGEGLITAVRDPVEKKVPVREKNLIVDYQTEIIDHGVEDKRLLALLPEYVRLLKVMAREGNTMSAIFRQALDSDDLSSLTKTPMRATGPHISAIAH